MDPEGASSGSRSADNDTLRLPLIVMVLAATAIPNEFCRGHNPVDVGIRVGDTVANVAGYVPRIASANGVNARGATTSGILDASWALDEDSGRASTDSSGHGLRGKFVHEPERVPGVIGKAVKLTSAKLTLIAAKPPQDSTQCLRRPLSNSSAEFH